MAFDLGLEIILKILSNESKAFSKDYRITSRDLGIQGKCYSEKSNKAFFLHSPFPHFFPSAVMTKQRELALLSPTM